MSTSPPRRPRRNAASAPAPQRQVGNDRIAGEQAALRRVATLVARGTPPGEVFAAVAAEVGQLLGVDFTFLSRCGPAAAVTIARSWTRTGTPGALAAGIRWCIRGRNLHAMVFRSHQLPRITTVDVQVTAREDILSMRVRDDGLGGAGFGSGSGLIGLRDRAEALGGQMRLDSPPGTGTTPEITLPLGPRR